MKPLVAIAGATSKQGRSVATTLLQRGQYRVRALTRNPAAPQAQALARLGAMPEHRRSYAPTSFGSIGR